MKIPVRRWLDDKHEKNMSAAAVSSTFDYLEKTLDSLTGLFECPICRTPIISPTETLCGHVFCKLCLNSVIKRPRSSCPLCKKNITNRGLISKPNIGEITKSLKEIEQTFRDELSMRRSNNTNGDLDKKVVVIQAEKNIDIELIDITEGTYDSSLSTNFSQSQTHLNSEKEGKENYNQNPMTVARTVSHPAPSSKENLRNTSTSNSSSKENRSESVRPMSPRPKTPSNQKSLQYIIFTSSTVPVRKEDCSDNEAGALDLSLSKKSEEYVYLHQTAFKFVKPLDLSMKKRKLDKVEPEPNLPQPSSSKNSPHNDNVNKRGKFEVKSLAPPPNPNSRSGNSNEDERGDKSVNVVVGSQDQQKSGPSGTDRKNEMTNSDELLNKMADAINCSFPQPPPDDPNPNPEEVSVLQATQPRRKRVQAKPKSVPESQTQMPSHLTSPFKIPASPSPSEVRTHRSQQQSHTKTAQPQPFDMDEEEFLLPRDSDAFFLEIPEPKFSSTPKNFADTQRKSSTSTQKKDEPEPVKKHTQPKETVATTTVVEKGDQDLFGEESDEWMNAITSGENKKQREDDDEGKNAHPPSITSNANIPQISEVEVEPVDELICDNNELNRDEAFARNNQDIVFCPSRLKKSQQQVLKKLCEIVGGTIIKDASPEFTHLIINLDNGRVPQTFKYLLAIAGHKWVVTFEWVQKCLEKGKLVPEVDYETSNYNFEHCDPGVRLSRLSKTNLFDGFKFYFAAEPYKNVGFTEKEVETLLNQLGAEVLKDIEDAEHQLIIVGCLMSGNKTEYNYWLHTRKWITVTFEWIVDCILEYRLQPLSDRYICVDGELTFRELRGLNLPESLRAIA